MKAFFSKAAIFIKYLKPNYYHQKIWIRIVIVLVALFVFSLLLRKIYEVPVNYTEIQVLHEGLMDDANLHVFIIKDYDRQKEASDNILNKDSIRRGGVIIEGVYTVRDSSGGFHSTFFGDVEKKEKVGKAIEAILDTAHFDYNNNLGETVYVLINTTSKQTFFTKNLDKSGSFEMHNTQWYEKSAFYHYGIYKSRDIDTTYCIRNKWYVPVDTIFKYGRLRQNNVGTCYESFIFASMGSKVVPIFNTLTGPNFEKPNPLVVAEDVSKVFEIVRIPLATAQFVNSITIDYRCPTEFGHLDPEPDEMTYSAIRYFDKDKIKKIAWDGLKFHAKFPDMENIQEVRIFVLTTIVTLLLTLLLSLLYKLVSSQIYRFWKKHTRLCVVLLFVIIAISTLYFAVFDHYTNVNYKELRYDTYGNDREWENYDF